MLRTALSTCRRCSGSPISNVNLLRATRSRLVLTVADRMLTCCSDMALVTSDSKPVRSSASTWIAARNLELSLGDQCTETTRSGCDWTRGRTLTHLVGCPDTPLPLVTKPVMLSPGTGVQHLDRRAQTSAAPSPDTPESPGATCGRGGLVSTVVSAMSSWAPASPPAAFTSLLTTFWALTWPSPTAA